MQKQIPFYLHKLRSEFDKRCEKNPAYSLRAFAKNLGLDAGTLSSVLKGQRRISKSSLNKVIEKLNLSPKEKNLFFESINLKKVFTQPTNSMRFLLDEEVHFKIISEWQHYAILSLFETKDFPAQFNEKQLVDWCSGRLALTKVKAQATLENLIQANLVKNEDGWKLVRSEGLRTTEDVSSAAIRKSRHEDLQLADKALHEIAVQLRDMSTMTTTVNIEDLPKLKTMIREFRKSFASVAEAQPGAEVYKLNLQFFPLTKLDN